MMSSSGCRIRDMVIRIDKGSRCVLRCTEVFNTFDNHDGICIVINVSIMTRKR